VIGTDPQTDVAVLKIEGNDFPAVALGDDAKTRVGEWAVAIGNPLGLDFTVTAGIISAKGRSNELRGLNQNQYAIQDFIQTDAAINPGNSGGPLVNLRGEVVGINSAIASQTGTYSGYGFAIPITLAKTVMDDIIAHGRVRRAIMGVRIQEITAEDAAVNGLKEIAGAKIGDFSGVENSPAEKAGLQPGDVIVKADGKPVDRVSTLQRIVRAKQPGDMIDLECVRYGKKASFKFKLMEAEGEKATVASAAREKDPSSAGSATAVVAKKLGVTVSAPPAELLRAAKTEVFGAFVKEVERGGPAASKLFVNDVITEVVFPQRTAIKTTADLQKALGAVKEGEFIGLKVARYNGDGTVGQTGVVNLRVGGN
jgi:serine protease Do